MLDKVKYESINLLINMLPKQAWPPYQDKRFRKTFEEQQLSRLLSHLQDFSKIKGKIVHKS